MKTNPTKSIPEYLVYEMKDHQPIYYKNYKLVLEKELPPEAVMGSSKIQALIIKIIVKFLLNKLDSNKYEVLFNEIGYQWDKGNWRNLDIAIFDKQELFKDGIDNSYSKIPPIVVMEVDTKADTSSYPDIEFYIREKIQDLLDHQVSRVIWFTTYDKKVLIAEKGQPWLLTNWDYDVLIMDDLYFNLHQALQNENVVI